MSICGRTILTLSDAAPDAGASGPVFAEPWQARAFAIAVLASKQGCFTWSEWTHALGRELHRAQDVAARGAAAGYFNCWLAALQSLLVGKGAIAWDELVERRDEYEDAYRRTPHGVPVSLCRLAE
jgi:nitrile hydratase accessory protein